MPIHSYTLSIYIYIYSKTIEETCWLCENWKESRRKIKQKTVKRAENWWSLVSSFVDRGSRGPNQNGCQAWGHHQTDRQAITLSRYVATKSVYIYIYIYVSVYISIYMYISPYVYIYIYVCIYIYICMYIYICVYIYIYINICIYIYIYVCVCVWLVYSRL